MARKSKETVTLEQLVAVAEEFNDFMEFEGESAIPTEGIKLPALKKEIIEAAQDLTEEDEITQATADVLDALGVEYPCAVVEGDDAGEEQEEEDEPEGKEEPEEGPDMTDQIAKTNKARKIDDILTIAKAERISVPPPMRKDIKKLKAYVAGKLEGIQAGEIKQRPAAAAKPKKEKTERGPSPYGTGVDLMCSNPDMDKDEYIKEMKKAGFTVEDNGSAMNTAYSAVKSIVGKLRAHKQMK